MSKHNTIDRLENLFDQLFLGSHQTRLKSGADEPFYQPQRSDAPVAVIFSRDDYVSSALHEISHWCIAGEERRKLEDYGYWYEPDGRNPLQQKAFENVEVKPQAIEWIFAKAMGHRFRVSHDNLVESMKTSNKVKKQQTERSFELRVLDQVNDYLLEGLPDRAQRFLNGLLNEFGSPEMMPQRESFSLAELV